MASATLASDHLQAGFSALCGMVDQGVISLEEGKRRTALLVKYTSIQGSADDDNDDDDEDDDDDDDGEGRQPDCFSRLHGFWRRCFVKIYFIDQAD